MQIFDEAIWYFSISCLSHILVIELRDVMCLQVCKGHKDSAFAFTLFLWYNRQCQAEILSIPITSLGGAEDQWTDFRTKFHIVL